MHKHPYNPLTAYQLIYINQTLRIDFGTMARGLKYPYQQTGFCSKKLKIERVSKKLKIE